MQKELTTVLVLVSVLALPRSQSEPTPAELVTQLAIPEQRAKAREQLLFLGKEAVPLLADGLRNADQVLLPELLTLLTDLGPDAGAAVPQLFDVLKTPSRESRAPTLWALSELAPYRAVDVEVDLNQLARSFSEQQMRASSSSSRIELGLAQQRLRCRLDFPRAPGLDTLLTVVQSRNAFRVELAVEYLGQRGAAASAALPFLRQLLERAEPRILTTERTVPIHRKAARALLAIAPEGAAAELARAVLAGNPPAPVAALPVPERARARITALIGELDVPAQRAAAAANLTALGKLAAPAVAGALLLEHSAEFREAALGVLRDLGPLASTTVPQLLEALTTLSCEHTISVLRALQATAPWCHDVVPELNCSSSLSRVEVLGRRIPGEVSADFLTSFFAAQTEYVTALAVDTSSSVSELGNLLTSPRVATRESALVVVRERGSSCRSLLPDLATMLEADQPKTGRVVWHADGSVSHTPVDRSEFVHRLAAQAIVAIAAIDDPLVARALAVLERPEPK